MGTYKEEYGEFGFEYQYKLPVVDRDGLDSIQISFDATVSSTSFSENYPLSIQLWNFDDNRWESIPLSPLSGTNYDSSKLDYDFWDWNPSDSPTSGVFRPGWSSINDNSVQTIGYGINHPTWVNSQGEIEFSTSVQNGGSFIDNDKTGYKVNNLYIEDEYKKLFYTYNDGYFSNKFQIKNIIVDPNAFYTSTTSFPQYSSGQSFSSANFYADFVNDLNEIKIRILTEKESIQTSDSIPYLCIGDFNCYVLVCFSKSH